MSLRVIFALTELNPALLNFSPSLHEPFIIWYKHVFMEMKSISLEDKRWIVPAESYHYFSETTLFYYKKKASIAVCTLQLWTRHFNHFNKAEATATKNYFINFLDLWLYNINRCLQQTKFQGEEMVRSHYRIGQKAPEEYMKYLVFQLHITNDIVSYLCLPQAVLYHHYLFKIDFLRLLKMLIIIYDFWLLGVETLWQGHTYHAGRFCTFLLLLLFSCISLISIYIVIYIRT